MEKKLSQQLKKTSVILISVDRQRPAGQVGMCFYFPNSFCFIIAILYWKAKKLRKGR